MEAGRHRRWLVSLCVMAASCALGGVARAQTSDGGDLSFELVDPKVLRGCAGRSADEICDALEQAVLDFSGQEPSDDTAILVLRVKD